MRYMMLLSGTSPSTPPPPELFEAIMKLGGEATQAGVLLDTAGLLPSASGARVSLAGGKLTVTDGPFTESKELISYALRSEEHTSELQSPVHLVCRLLLEKKKKKAKKKQSDLTP